MALSGNIGKLLNIIFLKDDEMAQLDSRSWSILKCQTLSAPGKRW